ncbi:YadA-like family protein [Oceanivirga salmonicida]|uniref:YadA-like family protein n=1 Tax=Oceanivirga salmonicida TaxID=1769291 RepID=UPI0012E1A005|nr:YadA C-terminal domain-containing protein [Oceanivirga salmonicida]
MNRNKKIKWLKILFNIRTLWLILIFLANGLIYGEDSRIEYEGDTGGSRKTGRLNFVGSENIRTRSGSFGIRLNLSNNVDLSNLILNGDLGEITGLKNLTWDRTNSGKIATEKQLEIIDKRIDDLNVKIANISSSTVMGDEKTTIKIENKDDNIVIKKSDNPKKYLIGFNNANLKNLGNGEVNKNDEKTLSGKTIFDYLEKNYAVSKKENNQFELNFDKKLLEDNLSNTFLQNDGSNIEIDKFTQKISSDADIANPKGKIVTDKLVKEHLEKEYYTKSEVEKRLGNIIGIDTLEKRFSGGVATSIAINNLPQVTGDNLLSIGASTSYYNKTGGFALGVSGTIPSNKIVYKLSAGIDTQKTFGIGTGINVNFIKNRKIETLDEKVTNFEKVLNDNSLDEEILKSNKNIDELKQLLFELKTVINEK